MTTRTEHVGFVHALYRYPVKSMAGEALETARLGWHGVDGDRRYAFTRTSQLVGFPWLTASKLPALLAYSPRFRTPDDPLSSSVVVRTPDGQALDLASDALRNEISTRYGAPVNLMKLNHGMFDAFPLSLISQETVAELRATVGRDLAMARFRPNIVITTAGEESFREDQWVGQRLRFGAHTEAPMMQVTERDIRCVVVNFDPQTLEKDAAILKAIVRTRQNCLGVYGSTERVGTIQVGDPVYRIP